MSFVNALLRGVFDGLLYPFRGLPPLVGLAVVSLFTAVVLLVAFKATSNQTRLEQIKRRIHAGIFEIRLFSDDMVAIFRAQSEILRHNLTYLRLSLVPMLWVIVPLVLVMGQLQFHYGYEGLQPGRSALLKVQLDKGSGAPAGKARPGAELTVGQGVRIDTPAVWLPAANELVWRVVAEHPGDYELKINVDGRTYEKSLHVGNEIVRRSPVRPASRFLDQLLYPAEPPLPAGSAVTGIWLSYPERSVRVFGWNLHWMIVYFLLAIVFAFALRRPFKVTI